MQKKNTTSKKATKRSAKRAPLNLGAAEPTEYFENGEEVLDLIAADRNDKRAARLILTTIEAEIVPQWLREAIVDALAEAARRKGSPLLVPVLKD